MRRLRWPGIAGAAVAAALSYGCMTPTQAVVDDVDLYDWQREQEGEEGVCVNIENGDTATLRDLSLIVRFNRLFKADTLHLELCIETPDSMRYTETVAFPISHPRRAAALRTVDEIPYRSRTVLDRMGTYRITLTPVRPVEGIEAAGINIVKSRENE